MAQLPGGTQQLAGSRKVGLCPCLLSTQAPPSEGWEAPAAWLPVALEYSCKGEIGPWDLQLRQPVQLPGWLSVYTVPHPS